MCVFQLLIRMGFTSGRRDQEYRPPVLALISYVSAGMVVTGGFIDLSIRSLIRLLRGAADHVRMGVACGRLSCQ